MEEAYDVAVVGAGPVGTALTLDLARRGRRVLLLEARSTRAPGSRAIGIHPPGLTSLDRLGVADALIAAGTPVRTGHATGARARIGTLDFAALPPPFPFVLCVPQPATERVLSEALLAARPKATVVGARVERVEQDPVGVTLVGCDEAGRRHRWRAAWAVGCDGRDGAIRTGIGVRWRGGPYPDRFAMADLSDDGAHALAPDAALIALHPAGVVESFPLPGGVRRWVVRVGPDGVPPAGVGGRELAAWVAERVEGRTARAPGGAWAGSASSFGVEHWLAARFAVGRVALAGDAAHVLSPIGGQGMNLGWLDAQAWAEAIDRALDLPADATETAVRLLARVGAARRRVAQCAIARAAWNTRLGRPHAPGAAAVRDAVLTRLLRPPWAALARKRFTMGGLA